MKKIRNALIFLSIFGMAPCVHAEGVLYSVSLLKVYTQSKLDSTAHLIQIDKSINSICSNNRLYIDINDKELFASALSNYLAGRRVDIIYQIDAPPKSIAGHIAGFTCRLVSIF